MSLLSSSSMESRWRGYEYFKNRKVQKLERLGDMRFQSIVSGSRKEPYTVVIDLEHVRRSSCTCPHAAGRRVICKHMVATFFAAFPEEAEKYYADVLKAEEEWENYQEELADKLVRYVRSLKKKEAQDKLLEVLEYGPEWQWDRFVRDYVEQCEVPLSSRQNREKVNRKYSKGVFLFYLSLD